MLSEEESFYLLLEDVSHSPKFCLNFVVTIVVKWSFVLILIVSDTGLFRKSLIRHDYN